MRHLTLLFLVSLAAAQSSAGGKWMLTVVTDKMTDAKTEQFYLPADSPIVGVGITSTPTLNILCSGSGRFDGAQLQTGVVLAVPEHPESHLYPLRIRLDSKLSTIFWNRFADGKTLDSLIADYSETSVRSQNFSKPATLGFNFRRSPATLWSLSSALPD